MDTELYDSLVNVMENVQATSACHQKYKKILLKLYQKVIPLSRNVNSSTFADFQSNVEAFYSCFERILCYILNQDPKARNRNVERVIDFCALFSTNCEIHFKTNGDIDDVYLYERVIYFLLGLSNLENEVVRYRVCQVVNKLFDHLTVMDADLHDDLCGQITEAMLDRVETDGKSEIRFQAISALYRLQNPDDLGCKIIHALTSRMVSDGNAKVRRICVQKIGIQKDVIAALILRTRDVSSDVRMAAFTRLSKLARHLQIAQKHTVIRNGFLDSSEHIKSFVTTRLVPAWFSEYDNNYLRLLKAVRLDSNKSAMEQTTEIVKYMLEALFSCRPCEEIMEVLNFNEKRILPYEDLCWESVIYWRFLIQTFQKSEKFEQHLTNVLPEVVVFAKYIMGYFKAKLPQKDSNDLEFQFILNQLFHIMLGCEVVDPVSQQAINKLVAGILQEVVLNTDVVTTIVKNLENSILRAEDQNKFVCEIISDIMYPTYSSENAQQVNDTTVQIAHVKVELNCLNEKLAAAVMQEDFHSAAELKAELERQKLALTVLEDSMKVSQVVAKKTDPDTVLKCLSIVRGLLMSQKVTTLGPVLETLCNGVIIEHLTDTDVSDEIRAKALECYALCCLVDGRTAARGISIFTTILLSGTLEEENCDLGCLQVAMKATFDLLLLYGCKLLNSDEQENQPAVLSLTDIIQTLVDLMDHENFEVQMCATRGLCSLILNHVVQSASLICRMVLKWCNPAADENYELQNLIGMMLEELPKIAGSGALIEKAILPTVKTLLKAPNTSPLSEVNIPGIVKFFLALCSICEENEGCSLQSKLATSICLEMRDSPTHRFNVVLSKILLMLDLSANDRHSLVELHELCEELRDVVNNRVVRSNIDNFTSHLDIIKSNISRIKEDVEE